MSYKLLQSKVQQRGQSLIELLIAIGLTAILLPALLTGIVSSREGKAQEAERLEALGLLREANEAVRNVREKGWSNIATNGSYYPTISGSTWTLTSGTQTIGNFTRSVTIESVQRNPAGAIVTAGGTVDPGTKKISTQVNWNNPYPSSVTSSEYLTRYLNNVAWLQTTQADFNLGTRTNVDTASVSGSVVLASTTNASGITIQNGGFNSNAANWTYNDWDQNGGEANATGKYNSSNGNPGGYVDIIIPAGNDDEVGGYWRQSITTSILNPLNTNISFDYRVLNFMSRTAPTQPVTFKVYAFVDTLSGDPVMGTQVWTSPELTATGNWTSTGIINISPRLSLIGLYYLKLGIWLETNAGTDVGPYTIGIDNVQIPSGYSLAGTLESSTFDAGTAVGWNYFTFTGLEPTNTNLQFQVATNNNNTTWNYTGPDGTATTYYESPLGLPLSLSPARYFRYKAFLSTTNSAVTPTLQDASVNYSP